MRPSIVLLVIAALLASGCAGSSRSVPEKGATYSYSVEGEPVEGERLDASYSLTVLEERGEVQEYLVETEIRGEPFNASFSVNKSSLDYVEKDPRGGAFVFDYLSAYSDPFPFVFRDVRPGEMEKLVEGGDVDKQGYSLSHEASLEYKGFEAVNVSLTSLEGARVSYYVVSTERPYLLFSTSGDSGYDVSLQSIQN